MRNILLALSLFAATCAHAADEVKTCKDCPPSAPCEYTVPMDCNTGYGAAYCIDGKWYGGITRATLANCGPPQISNPFDHNGAIPADLFRRFSTTEAK
jgi:hypothetical protein